MSLILLGGIMLKNIKEKFKKINSLSLYVIFSIISLLIYTIISQYLAIYYDKVLDTLTTCFFSFFGGEVVTCGLIKIFKLKDTKKEVDNDIAVG